MIRYGPYEAQCADGIPANAVTRTDPNGDVYVLYIPTPKGDEFHASTARYVLGEGGRGSGKSQILRWDAHLRNIMQPGHRALLLRRTFPQLRGSHFAKVAVEGALFGKEICPDKFNQTKYNLVYANGSLLQFGHVQDDAAVLDYLSQEWDWIGFDELTTFTFDQFIRVSASSRSIVGSNKVSLIRAATNPIGIGAAWVKRYFVDHSVTEEEAPDYLAKEWIDIKMNLPDNPHMPADYRQTLLMQPNQTLRRAYADGEWLVEGQFFSEFSPHHRETGKDWHVLSAMPTLIYEDRRLPAHRVPWIQVTRTIDWGYSEIQPGYCGWIAHMPDGTAILFQEWVFTGKIPEVAAATIKEMSVGMNVRMSLGDPSMWEERTGESIAHRFAVNGVSMIPAKHDRENGWMGLHTWLVGTHNDGNGPRPRLQLLAPQEPGTGLGAPYAIRTLPSLQTDPKRPRDITQETGVEDHAADALRYWASGWPAPSHEPAKNLDWTADAVRIGMAEGLLDESSALL